jgi:hypothetical protein
LAERIDSVFDKLAPTHIWVLGLLLLILIGVFSTHLIVWKLSFRFLIVVMALGIGGGMAYLGRECSATPSTQRLLFRMLLVFVCVALWLVAIRLIDSVLLLLYANGAGRAVYRIPGVYAELSAGSRRLFIDNVPPYWLGVTLYGLLTAVIGYLIHRAATSEIEMS